MDAPRKPPDVRLRRPADGVPGPFTAWIVVMVLNPRTLVIGAIWMFAGITICSTAARRDLGGRDPQGPAGVARGGGDRVPERPRRVRGRRAVLGADSCHRRQAGLEAPPWDPRDFGSDGPTHLPLDAELEDQEGEAQSKIEQAKLVGGLRVSGHVHRVRPGQAGHRIAGEAQGARGERAGDGARYRNGAPSTERRSRR